MEDRGEVGRRSRSSTGWAFRSKSAIIHSAPSCADLFEEHSVGRADKEILTFVARQLASAVEIKRNEQALRRSEARYRSLVQSSAYGIYRSSLEGRFLDVNPALIAMLGYDIGRRGAAAGSENDVFDQPKSTRAYRGVSPRGPYGRHRSEVEAARTEKPITVRISGRAVSSADEPADVLEAIAEDVTERRMLEDQFRQAQKMEAVAGSPEAWPTTSTTC